MSVMTILLLVSLKSIQALPAGRGSKAIHDTLDDFNRAYSEPSGANSKEYPYYEPCYRNQAAPSLDRQDSFDFLGVSDEINNVFGCYKGEEVNSYDPQEVLPNHQHGRPYSDMPHEEVPYQHQHGIHSPARQASDSDFFAGVSGIIDRYRHYESDVDGDEEVSSSLPQSSGAGASTVYKPFEDFDLRDPFYRSDIYCQESQEEQQRDHQAPEMQSRGNLHPVSREKGRVERKKCVADAAHSGARKQTRIRASGQDPQDAYSYGFPDPLWFNKMSDPKAKINARSVYEKYATKESRRGKKFEERCNLATARDLLNGTEAEQRRAAFWIQWGSSTFLRYPKLRKYLGEHETWVLINQVNEAIGGDMEETLYVIESMMEPEMAERLVSKGALIRAEEIEKITRFFTTNSVGKMYSRKRN